MSISAYREARSLREVLFDRAVKVTGPLPAALNAEIDAAYDMEAQALRELATRPIITNIEFLNAARVLAELVEEGAWDDLVSALARTLSGARIED